MSSVLACQTKLVLVPKFDPVQFLEAMQNDRISVGFLVPPILLFLTNHPMVKGYDLSAIRFILSGAAPLDSETQAGLAKKLSTSIRQGWGMTELAPYASGNLHKGCVIMPGSAGLLAPNTEGIIVDAETGESLPSGESGELLIRGPQVMLGYLNRPEATAETIRPDGFLRTGDLASFTPDGNIVITDRLKELIKVKGLQVAPAEIEGHLLAHDAIVDAAVIGVPDERSGQVPKAFIVTASGAELGAEAVREYLGASVAPYKVPEEVVFIEAIPKSAAGKILRKNLS